MPQAGLLSERRTRELSNIKRQLLLYERAWLAAVTYVDLNPERANIAPGLNR